MVRKRLKRMLALVGPVAAVVVVLAGGALAGIETDTVGSYGEGAWWALSLMSTVGFAGETPQTDGGRIVSGFLMVVGFTLLSLTTATVASLFVVEEEDPEVERGRISEQEVLGELRRVRDRLESLEAQLSRRR
jgi:voltage-gated potassium channel